METPTQEPAQPTPPVDDTPTCSKGVFLERHNSEVLRNSGTYIMYTNFDPIKEPDADII